jgi:hypothetical protein
MVKKKGRESKKPEVKCESPDCDKIATTWINGQKVCKEHYYLKQVENGNPPRRLPRWAKEKMGRGK